MRCVVSMVSFIVQSMRLSRSDAGVLQIWRFWAILDIVANLVCAMLRRWWFTNLSRKWTRSWSVCWQSFCMFLILLERCKEYRMMVSRFGVLRNIILIEMYECTARRSWPFDDERMSLSCIIFKELLELFCGATRAHRIAFGMFVRCGTILNYIFWTLQLQAGVASVRKGC